MTRSPLALASLGAVALGVVLTARIALGTKPAAPSEAPRAEIHAVRGANIDRGQLTRTVHAAGLVRAKSEVDLAFLLGGEITWLGVDVGAKVTRGQVLARLDTTVAAADVDRARAADEKAKRDLGRVKTLAVAGSLPKNDLDDATTGSDVAAATLRSADFALRHGVLVAPEDGVIEARAAEPHQVVGAGQPVLRMSGRSRGVVVRVGLTDRDALATRLGADARVTVDALPGAPFDAKVTQIAAAATPGTGTFEVEITLAGDTSRLGNGLSAKVELPQLLDAASSVPLAALVDGDGDRAFVIAVDDGVAHKVPVRVAFFEGERAVLKDALSGHSRVATSGAAGLDEGDRVEEAK